jgi:archaeal flagellar protein FlaI
MVYTKEVQQVEVVEEGAEQVLRVNYENVSHSPSIEGNPLVMMDAIDKLIGTPAASRLTFTQRRNFNYDYEQTQMLMEFANIYSFFVKNKKATALQNLGLATDPPQLLGQRFESIRYILFNLLKADPLGAYMELKRLMRQQEVTLRSLADFTEKQSLNKFMDVLKRIYKQMDETKLVNLSREYLAGYTVGQRDVYKLFFRPSITPNFMYSRLMTSPPEGGTQIAAYKINPTCDVAIFDQVDDLKKLYQINPPEFNLSEDKYQILELAKKVLAEHQPRNEEFLDPQKLRATFTNIGTDMIRELAESKGLFLEPEEIQELSEILVRHTIGFGLIELLLEDEKVQDLTINSPMGQVPIFLLHDEFNECVTNITPTTNDFESWATKFRLLSGRPLDEANPILDTEIHLPTARSRLSVIGKPLNPYGFGMSFRRHRDDPWTLPLFIENNMISALGAGLMSFIIQGNRSFLVCGTRSSGKSSFLGSLLLEIMRKYRILTIEDTLELPTDAMRKLGYNIQPLKVRSALAKGGSEVASDEGIRASLRLGDSALIVGEVRSKEALALYEAMRIGASANVVAGTFHADSPYGVFDRVANDLGVPRTSFKATDLIIICAPIQSASGLSKLRRVVSITEVRKEWEEDPMLEGGFVDLMRYNAKTDTLEPTPELINGDSEVLKAIGGNVKEWIGDWNSIWNNILMRAECKKMLVEYSKRTKLRKILEAEFSLQANDRIFRLTDLVKQEVGFIDCNKIQEKFEEWLKGEILKIQLSGSR